MNTEIKLHTLSPEEHQLLIQALAYLRETKENAKKSPLDKFLLQEQILKKFNWSYKVLERARKQKGDMLPYSKRGGKFIYLVEDFESWLMRNYSKLEIPAEEKKKYNAGRRNF